MDAFDWGWNIGLGAGIGIAWATTGIVSQKFNIEGWYRKGCVASAIIIFCTLYGSCAGYYDFLLGVGLGWLPSLIAAAILCWFWPLVPVGFIAAVLYNVHNHLYGPLF